MSNTLSRQGNPRTAVYLVPAVVAVLATGVVFYAAPSVVVGLGAIIMTVGVSTLGATISRNQPGNRIGLLLQVMALSLLFALAGDTVPAIEPPTDGTLAQGSVLDVVKLVSESGGVVGIAAIFLILLIFPDGHFLSRRWRVFAMLLSGFLALFVLATVFSSQLGDIWNDQPYGSNLVGFVPWEVTRSLAIIAGPAMLIGAVAGVVAVIIRFRRSDAVGRAQVKWMALAGLVMLFSFPIAIGDDPALEAVGWFIFYLSIPVGITIAITRYKLFEIDRLISRTISYAIIVAFLAATFAGMITLITRLLGAQNNLAVAASTLAVAALFNPLRRKVRSVIDRRFNRSSYQAQSVAEEFGLELRQPHTAGEVARLLNQTVDRTLQPAASGVWLNVEKQPPRG